MDEDEWDRFAYWNDIEYDSDGYHDIDHERMKRRRDMAAKRQTGTLKRKSAAANRTPTKRRKGAAGKVHAVGQNTHTTVDSPVVWRPKEDENAVPIHEERVDAFSLLKDWRARFPDHNTSSDDSADDATTSKQASQAKGDDEDALEIDPNILRAALQANLAKLTGPGASGDPKESMLLDYVTRMLSGGGSSDDIAGELADALFAKDGDNTEDDGDAEGGGDFGQWVLERAEAQAGGSAVGVVGEPSPANSAEEDSGGTRNDGHRNVPVSPLPTVPADRRPPTPGSTQTRSSVDTPKKNGTAQKIEQEPLKPEAPKPNASAPAAAVRGRKRKAEDDKESSSQAAPSKRAATRSYDAPTASSKAKTSTTPNAKPAPKRSTRASTKKS